MWSWAIVWGAACGVSSSGPPLPFESCSATSVLSGEFAATNALSPGLDYWSSEGPLDASEEVTWKGGFGSLTDVRGLEIRWALAPSELEVLGSGDKLTDRVLMDWRGTTNSDASFSELLEFPKGTETVLEIKLVMKGMPHDYIGIQQVRAVGSDQQIFMLVSGIESPRAEQCLQGAGTGAMVQAAEVVVGSCEFALATGTGNDVWLRTPTGQLVLAQSEPTLCLDWGDTAQYNDELLGSACPPGVENCVQNKTGTTTGTTTTGTTTGSGSATLQLQPCTETDSRFDYQPNGQLRAVIDRRDLCLTVQGSKPGMGNLLETHEQGSEASSVADTDHESDNALTASLETFWASKGFTDCSEHNVYWQFDFGQAVKIHQVKIDWEYSPLAYSLMASSDGNAFTTLVFNPVNPNNVTLDDLGVAKTRWIRVVMHKPHPVHGLVTQSSSSAAAKTGAAKGQVYGYGIRNIKILQNKLKLNLINCDKAGKLTTGGDKWFLNAVRNFNADEARRTRLSGEDYVETLKSVQQSASNLAEVLPDISSCKSVVAGLQKEYDKTEKIQEIRDRLRSLEEKPTSFALTQPILGMSREYPLMSTCKVSAGSSGVGFYYVQVPCSSTGVLRLFCDDENDGLFLYDGARVATRESTLDIERACATEGLMPVVVKSAKEYEYMVTMLKSMSLRGRANIPLAFDLGCARGSCLGVYHDLGRLAEVSSVLTRYLSTSGSSSASDSGSTSGSALALVSRGGVWTVDYSDWLSEVQSGFLCSQLGSLREAGYRAMLACSTRGTSPIFQGGRNTFVRVSCPGNCGLVAEHEVFGGTGLYADRSHVCKAAVHAGVRDLADFLVALESPAASYGAVVSNGISSRALAGPTTSALRLLDALDRCPVQDLLAATVETRVMKDLNAQIVLPKTQDWTESESLGAQKAVTAQLNAAPLAAGANKATIESWNRTRDLSALLQKVDALSLTYSRQTTVTSLVDGRGLVKPIEVTTTRLQGRSDQSYVILTRTVKRVLGVVAEYFTKLMETQSRSAALIQSRQRHIAVLDLDRDDLSLEDFLAFPPSRATSATTATFSLGRSDTLAHRVIIMQATAGAEIGTDSESAVVEFVEGQPLEFGGESILLTRNLYHYDGELTAELTVRGTVLVGWRVRAASGDGFWLWLSPDRVSEEPRVRFKLVRRFKGRVSSLSLWASVLVSDAETVRLRVTLGRGRHTLFLEGLRALDVFDETLTSGQLALGIWTGAAEAYLHFEPHCCEKPSTTRVLRAPARCASFQDTFRLAPSETFLLSPRHDATLQRNLQGRTTAYRLSHWSQSANGRAANGRAANGRRENSVRGPSAPQSDGTQPHWAMLDLPGRHTSCSQGTFTFDFLATPECPDLEIGPIIWPQPFLNDIPGDHEEEGDESGRDTAPDHSIYQWLAVTPSGSAKGYANRGAPSTPLLQPPLAQSSLIHIPVVVDEQFLEPLLHNRWYTLTTLLTPEDSNLLVLDGRRELGFLSVRNRQESSDQDYRIGIAYRNCDHAFVTRIRLHP